MNKKSSTQSVRKLVLLALLTAIVVVLQMVGATIRFGQFSITLVLAPVVIAAALYGPGAGAYLGGVFGVVVLLSGDASVFLAISPVGTILTVMAKGILSGFAAGWVYRLIARDSVSRGRRLTATIFSGIACPVVNTGIFLAGCFMFFLGWITDTAAAAGFGTNIGKFVVFGLVGLNFVVELAINLVLASVIVRLIEAGQKSSTGEELV